MSTTSIEWTEQTWNPLAGCKEISPGCANCYAARMAHRLAAMGQKKYQGTTKKLPNGKIVWTGEINLDPDSLLAPLERKTPTMYFVNSMSDLFHKDVPLRFIAKVLGVIAYRRRHTFQLLTKRAERMAQAMHKLTLEDCLNQAGLAPDFLPAWPLENLWPGVSVEDKKRGMPRIEHLRQTPAAVRMLSIEPLLEDLGQLDLEGIGWVIVGGESGPGARPLHPAWVRSIRDQCVRARVPFFFKQWGHWLPFTEGGDDGPELEPGKAKWLARDTELNEAGGRPKPQFALMMPVGKKAAGRLLDGREWNEMPAQREAVPA